MKEINISDEEGNKLRVTNNTVWLKLKKESWERNIGTIVNGTYTKHVKKEHIFKKGGDAFGFNYKIIDVLNPKVIIVLYNGYKYTISRKNFEDNKFFMWFKQEGFERQCFIRLSVFE